MPTGENQKVVNKFKDQISPEIYRIMYNWVVEIAD